MKSDWDDDHDYTDYIDEPIDLCDVTYYLLSRGLGIGLFALFLEPTVAFINKW